MASRSRSFVAFAGIIAALVVVDRAALRAQIRYDVVDPAHLAKVSMSSCALDKALRALSPKVVASPQGTWTAIVEQTDPAAVPYDQAKACVKLNGGTGVRSVSLGAFRTLHVTWINERLLYFFTDVGHAAGVGQLLDLDDATWVYVKTEYYPEPAQTGPPALRQPDALVIEAARKTIAQDIDPKLPKTTFEAWLRSVVGAQPAMTWAVNDCGEQTGNPALDRGRDFPMCVEIHVPLAPKRDLYLSLLMGTFAKGLGSGNPAFHHGSLNTPDGKSQDVRALSDLPALLAKKKPTPGVGFLAQRGKRTPGASLKSGSIARLIARISSIPASP